eukprot:NODE_21642_length_743_cov_4.038961.p5 GENE.NODE_21642_length_743_cov_4.038961~~NODE_21642_length_743_cov_4.038961.p5  ORF type:complete len:54 (-),score=20.28 NODE_21642_length_743_cov_4.038961:215-376(-)
MMQPFGDDYALRVPLTVDMAVGPSLHEHMRLPREALEAPPPPPVAPLHPHYNT